MSWRIEAISADSTRLGMLHDPSEVLLAEPNGDGCLDIASVVWLPLLGRGLMSKRNGRVCCLGRNNRELVISSCSVAKDFHQGLVVSDDNDIITTLCEVLGLLKAPNHGQCFPFNGCIALFCRGQELRAGQGDPPSSGAAVRDAGRAAAMLLE